MIPRTGVTLVRGSSNPMVKAPLKPYTIGSPPHLGLACYPCRSSQYHIIWLLMYCIGSYRPTHLHNKLGTSEINNQVKLLCVGKHVWVNMVASSIYYPVCDTGSSQHFPAFTITPPSYHLECCLSTRNFRVVFL